MKLNEAISELNLLFAAFNGKFVSHYAIENKLKKILANVILSDEPAETVDTFNALKIKLEAQIKVLKEKNGTTIKSLKFQETCVELIDAHDKINFAGLVGIAEYFGTGKGQRDALSALDFLYEYYQATPQKRIKENAALEHLCFLVDKPNFPKIHIDFTIAKTPRDRLKDILAADSSTELMSWCVNAEANDLGFALRSAASVNSCLNCLAFLLLRTAPENEYAKINLLEPGTPSGKTALHRAVLSQKTILVQMLLDTAYNPSNDLLKQLLIRDKDSCTPIDLINNMLDKADLVDCERMLDKMQDALTKYKDDSRLGITETEAMSIQQSLEKIKTKIAEMPKEKVYQVGQFSVSIPLQ